MHYFLCLCFEIWYCCVDYPRCSLSQTKMFKGCSRCQCLDYKLHTKSNRVYMGLLLIIMMIWWCALVVGGVHIYILTLKWDYLILLLIHLAFKFFFIISNAIIALFNFFIDGEKYSRYYTTKHWCLPILGHQWYLYCILYWQLAIGILLFIGSLYIGHRTIGYRFIPKK